MVKTEKVANPENTIPGTTDISVLYDRPTKATKRATMKHKQQYEEKIYQQQRQAKQPSLSHLLLPFATPP